MKLGGIYISVSARTSKLKRDLAKAEGLTKKTAVVMKHAISSIDFVKVGIAATAFTAAFAYGVTKVTKTFLNAAITSEGYRVRLNALLGSVKEGTRAFEEMSKFAGEVPYQYEEIMGAATTLAGIMRGGINEIKQWMPMIADLAAVSGLTLQQTTEQIVRMYSAGAASADMFRERGILAMLGFEAGVHYTAEETKRIMFESWNKQGSKFKDVTKDLAKTWEGTMSMIGDKWFQLRNIIMDAGLFDEMKKNLELFNKEMGIWIENNKELIKQKVPEYIDKLKEGLKDVLWVAQKVGWSMGIIKDTMELMYKTMTPTPDVVWPWEYKKPEIEIKRYPIKHPPSRLDPTEEKTYEQTEKTKEIYAKYYEALEEMADNADMIEIMRERERLEELKPFITARLALKETENQELLALDEEMEDEKRRMTQETAAYQKKLNAQRFSDMQSSISMMTQGFQTISEMGGKHSKKAFAMYKAFKIIETTISTYSAAIKAYESLVGIPYIGPFIAPAAAAAAVAFGMAQISMIKQAQPPSYDQGGVSNAEGLYRTGPIREAHIPIPSGGKIPIKVEGKEKQTIQIILNNPVFQDLETQRQVMAQIAAVVATQVAPGAVIENYNNDLEIRQMVRRGM